ncbi:MAG TPA: hypothetical protein DCM40_17430 [Maribacter sp.]|nr:hypothetical protein [Maribacter sp.]
MAKLDEITELLTDELEAFKKGITQLEKLSKELKSSKEVLDIYTIKRQLSELREKQDAHFQRHEGELRELSEKLAIAKLTPKWLLALFCIVFTLVVTALSYFSYHFIQLDDFKIEAFKDGKEQVILDLRSYFDEHPDVYKGFQSWSKRQDSVPNQK